MPSPHKETRTRCCASVSDGPQAACTCGIPASPCATQGGTAATACLRTTAHPHGATPSKHQRVGDNQDEHWSMEREVDTHITLGTSFPSCTPRSASNKLDSNSPRRTDIGDARTPNSTQTPTRPHQRKPGRTWPLEGQGRTTAAIRSAPCLGSASRPPAHTSRCAWVITQSARASAPAVILPYYRYVASRREATPHTQR